jgi:hypothetical protein
VACGDRITQKIPGETAPHIWSFMSQVGKLTIRAPYSTGTVTIVAGVATLAGGTWPSWAAAGDLIVSGVRYSVNTRDSNSQITLNDTSVTASAGTSYELIQFYYELASDFGSLIADGFTYSRSETMGCSPLRRRRTLTFALLTGSTARLAGPRITRLATSLPVGRMTHASKCSSSRSPVPIARWNIATR